MKIFDDFQKCAPLRDSVHAAVGNFDGMHRGHRAILARAVEGARETKGTSLAVTFHPHPMRVLALEKLQPMISTHEQKLELLEAEGLDAVLVLAFTREFAAHTPASFVSEMQAAMPLSEIVVGEDFRFGHLNAGDAETLRTECESRGLRATVVPLIESGGHKLSSSRIRHLLGEGHVEDAAALLGHAYFIDGTVVDGDKRGRELGFPTANLQALNEIIPYTGVYATRLRVRGASYPSVTNVGFRPTFELQSGIRIETHIPDFKGDILGEKVRLEFVRFLREEMKFPGVEALKAQIEKDIQDARETLA